MQISKKELLDLTNISYGQLYRWKRKGLIPDEWFTKKSSFTGQETFFPKKEVLERVKKILELKDVMPLEEVKEHLDGSQYIKAYKKDVVKTLFPNVDSLSDNISYFEMVGLEIVSDKKELYDEVKTIGEHLNINNLKHKFYYFRGDNIWLISDNIITSKTYEMVDIQNSVEILNKKITDGELL